MQIIKILNKTLNRKKFFSSAALSAAGFIVLRSFPFNMIKKNKEEDIVVNIKLNTQSISRTKIGEKNV